MGNVESTYDLLPEKFGSNGFGDFSKWSCFDPFREVVDNGITSISLPFCKGPIKVNSLFRKWPWAWYRHEALGWLPLNIKESLALIIFSYELEHILFQDRLVVSLPEHLVCQCWPSRWFHIFLCESLLICKQHPFLPCNREEVTKSLFRIEYHLAKGYEQPLFDAFWPQYYHLVRFGLLGKLWWLASIIGYHRSTSSLLPLQLMVWEGAR